MKRPKVEEKLSQCREKGAVEENELLATLRAHMPEEAWVYAVLDYAVALGRYREKRIELGLGQEKKIVEVPLPYVQELRVFNKTREFFAIRSKGEFHWRLRVDGVGKDCSVLDETHKIWGRVERETDKGEWSLLRSQRGTALYFPEEIKLHGEKGLLVRNYIAFHDAQQQDGLLHFVDERLLAFINWPPQEEEVQRYAVG